MKAYDANLLDLLKKNNQFVVPIYQRIYSWEQKECRRFWDDIISVGGLDLRAEHFTGAIVYVKQAEGTLTSTEPNLLIDGQQRVTTVMLLLAALAKHLDNLPAEHREPVEGFLPRKIRNRYLTNPDEDGDKSFKLLLSKSDENALKTVINQAPIATENGSRVFANYSLFLEWLSDTDLAQLCNGLRKLMVVDVSLTLGVDNPQLVFETMNSTGKKLSQADLIRNFMLMDLPNREQSKLYNEYWYPMEQIFHGANEKRFDEFVRHYLSYKTGDIIKLNDIYDAFKRHAANSAVVGETKRTLITDLHQQAHWFSAIALGSETHPELRRRFADISRLKATVTYPFILRLYSDYSAEIIDVQEFAQILDVVISYLFRRAVCQIPTNSLISTFSSMARAKTPENYVEGFIAQFLLRPTYKRFPDDVEFRRSLVEINMYSFARRNFLFRNLENYQRKEEVSITEYTVEHIMPQNPKLSPAWQSALGREWKDLQTTYLHTLGNLTLTGYNPEYSDKSFAEKRDMDGGFKNSPLRLNAGLGEYDTWNQNTILERAEKLSKQAVKIWPRPELPSSLLEKYRTEFNDKSGFDWKQTHQILEQLPQGRWTTYNQLADAVETSAQPLATHLAKCTDCTNAHKVLLWDGRISSGFRWLDPSNERPLQEVLEAEGIIFEKDKASPAQRLDTEDLLELIETDSLSAEVP